MKRLHELRLTLGATLDPAVETAAFMAWLAESIAPRLAALFLADEARQELRLAGAYGFAPAGEPRLPLDLDPWRWLAEQGVAVPAEEDPRRYAAPLSMGNRLLGALHMVSSGPTADLAEEQRVVQIAANDLVLVLHNIRRYQKLEQQVTERTAALSTLNAIALAVSYSLDLETTLAAALDTTLQAIGFEIGGIALWNEAEQRLERVTTQGVEPEVAQVFLSPPRSGGHRECLLRYGQPVFHDDTSHDLTVNPELARHGFTFSAMAPLTHGGKVLGIMAVATRTPGCWTEEEKQLLTTAAQQIAVAVANAQLYDAAQRELAERVRAEDALRLRMEQLSALAAAGQAVTASLDLEQVLAQIVALAGQVVGPAQASVVLVDEAGQMHESAEGVAGMPAIRYRVRSAGFADWIIRSRRPVIVDDIGPDGAVSPAAGPDAPQTANPALAAAGIRSFAGLPLVAKDRLLGVLFLHNRQTRAFHGQLELLTAFASQAAIAVENARLYDAAQQELAARRQAEAERTVVLEALRESESKLKEAQRLGRIGHGEFDQRTQRIQWSDMVYTIYERDPQLGPPTAEEEASYYSPEDAARLRQSAMRTIETGEPYEIEVRVNLSGGRYADMVAKGIPIRDDHGHVVRLLGTVQDITARKQAEEALRASQAELAAVFESTPIFLALVDEERRVTKINHAGADFTGRPADELLGLRQGEVLRCFHALDDPRGCGFGPHCERCAVRSSVLDTLQTGRSYFQVEADYPVRRDGRVETLRLLISTAAVTVPAGRRVLVSIEDITGRHRSHEALHVIYDLSQKLVLSRRVEEIAQQVTDAAQAVLRFPRCELWLLDEQAHAVTSVAQTPAEPTLALPSLPLDGERGIIATVVRSGQTIYLPDVDQDPRYIRDGSYPSCSELCVPLKVRKRTIGALNTESDRPDAFSPAERELLEALANAAAVAIENARLYGETRRRAAHQQALNAIITATTTATDLPSLLETALEHTLAGLRLEMGAIWVREYPGGPITARVVRGLPDPTGMAMEIEITGVGHAARLPQGVSLVVNDWRQVAGPYAALAPVMARHHVAASVTVPIGEPGRALGELSVAAGQPRAWSAEEVALIEAVGRQLAAAIERLQLLRQVQRQAAQMQEMLDNVPAGVLLLDAGHRIVVANPLAWEYLTVLDGAGAGEALAHLGGRPIAEFLRPSATGAAHELMVKGPPERVFTVLAEAVPVEGTAAAAGWVLVLRDATQERAERERIEVRDRLAAVGQLAAGIAHDFNNIMSVIVLQTYLAQKSAGLTSKTQERLNLIAQQAEQASKLIEQILDFSRRSMLERRPLDLLPFLKEQVKLLQRTLPEHIRIVLNHSREVYTVNADPTRLQQVFMNLALNARDAMPRGGRLQFDLDRLDVTGPRDTPLPDMPSGRWVRVRVSDNGAGIPADVLPRIFEPFFTTKAPGQGTGLGLSQVYGIVKQHDGEIEVDSIAGRGATFTIYLPMLTAVAAQAMGPATPEPEHGAGQTILIVEDNEATRAALADALEALEYQVLQATGGQQALEMLAQHRDEIALVLTDLVMPDIGGSAMLQAMRGRKLDTPVIILTGHAFDERIDELRPYGLAGWLPKPPDLEELAKMIKWSVSAA